MVGRGSPQSAPRGRSGPSGHSLVELIVTMVVLGVGLGGVAATSALSLRMSHDAFRLEEEVARTVVILDSLSTHEGPTPGALAAGGTAFEWTVTPAVGGWAHVAVVATDVSTGSARIELTGAWAPPPQRVSEPGPVP